MQAPRIRFGLRTLLLLFVLVAIGATGWRLQRGRRQYTSSLAIAKAGNIVLYDHYFDEAGNFISGPTPAHPGPKWVRRVLGDGTFASVKRLTIGSEFCDEHAVYLGDLYTLESLDLSDRNVSDAAMPHVARLPALKRLSLRGTQVTDAGMKWLSRSSKLETLSLSHTSVSGAGLSFLGHLPNLKVLDLSFTQVGDHGAPALSQCATLEQLSLASTLLTDAGLKSLAATPKLQTLDIARTNITQVGLLALARHRTLRRVGIDGCSLPFQATVETFTQNSDRSCFEVLEMLEIKRRSRIRFDGFDQADLRWLCRQSGAEHIRELHLRNAQISDAWIDSLVELQELQTLYVDGGELSQEGLRRLRDELPKLTQLWIPGVPFEIQTGVPLEIRNE